MTTLAGDTAATRQFGFAERDFRRVCALIRERAGIALADSKRDMVYSRLVRRLRALGVASFAQYLDALQAGPDDAEEWQAFTNALTTNLTSFFREAHHFEHLAELLRTRAEPRIKIWCAAASTGEEPYSIAMTACETFGTLTPPVQILATDVDTNVLDTARTGVYPLDRVRQLVHERKRSFFQRGTGSMDGYCRVHPALRQLVSFRPLNLLDAGYGLGGGFAAIFCRNVMIYFDKHTQYEVLARLRPLIAPGGFLYAGHSESFFHATDLFSSCGRTVYAPVAPRGTAS
ncbi:MAG TPA: CheR family methyltransferase [Rudaea sp.]